MSVEDINNCQIQEWYPKFKSVSIRTLIHELPESFVEYLDDSGSLHLPISIMNKDALPKRMPKREDADDFVTDELSDDEAEIPSSPPSFPDLEIEIESSIDSLGGAVFPKLNWSAPKDAAWINASGNLRCASFSEIALLLKSSDSIFHDLSHAYDCCKDKTSSRPLKFFLALRKWCPSLKPEMEFRCFVNHNLLIGVSQREVTTFYPSLLDMKHDLKVSIQEFFMENLQGKFSSESYTFDVYVTKDRRVKLFDFNPWCASTLPLLFSWEELAAKPIEEPEMVEFRIIESPHGIRPGLKTAVPYDYLDTSSGSGWDQFFQRFEELQSPSVEV